MLINVIDIEASCWLGHPPDGQSQEIIEIGIAVIDQDKKEIISKESIKVKPCMSEISEFCTKLTGWTKEALQDGLSYKQALVKLEEDYKCRERIWISCGNFDKNMFKRQCAAMGLANPLSENHVNIKALHSILTGRKMREGMTGLLQLYGLELEGQHHNGADDAYNIAKVVVEMLKRGSFKL